MRGMWGLWGSCTQYITRAHAPVDRLRVKPPYKPNNANRHRPHCSGAKTGAIWWDGEQPGRPTARGRRAVCCDSGGAERSSLAEFYLAGEAVNATGCVTCSK